MLTVMVCEMIGNRPTDSTRSTPAARTARPATPTTTNCQIGGNNNTASTSTDNTVTYDTASPTLTSITIGDTSDYTRIANPTITIVSSGSPSHVAFSCNGGTNWSSWIAYADSISSFNITNGATGCTTSDGSKTITAKLKDAATNESGTANDTIFYDTTAPASFDLDSPGDNSYTNSQRPSFKWKATTDATSGVSKYSVEVDNGDNGDFTLDDIPTSRTTDYETNKYVAHYEGGIFLSTQSQRMIGVRIITTEN